MDKSLQNIRAYTEQQSLRNERDIKHAALIDSNTQTQQVIVEVMRKLVDFLDNRVSKTEVVNQLQEIGTPDAYKVVEAVNGLHQTIATQEQVDLSEMTDLLRSVLDEAKKIPKSHSDIEIPKPIDNTAQFKSLEQAVKAMDSSIKAQKLVAEAPIVNVPETVVNVEKPDLSPLEGELQTSRKEFVKAVKGIVIPETDVKPLEKELKKLNKLFNDFLETVPMGGGGSGGLATPYTKDGLPHFVNAESDGSLPVTVKNSSSSTVYSKPTDSYSLVQFDDTSSASYEYYAYMDKDSNWYIKRLTTATNLFEFVAGSSSYSTAWTNRASQTYATYGVTF